MTLLYSDKPDIDTKKGDVWNFNHCPFCGRKVGIELTGTGIFL